MPVTTATWAPTLVSFLISEPSSDFCHSNGLNTMLPVSKSSCTGDCSRASAASLAVKSRSGKTLADALIIPLVVSSMACLSAAM